MDYEFSNDLKAVREILGISQKDLAKTLGVHLPGIRTLRLWLTMPARFILWTDSRRDMTRSLAKLILKEDMVLFLCSGSFLSGRENEYACAYIYELEPASIRSGRAD